MGDPSSSLRRRGHGRCLRIRLVPPCPVLPALEMHSLALWGAKLHPQGQPALDLTMRRLEHRSRRARQSNMRTTAVAMCDAYAILRTIPSLVLNSRGWAVPAKPGEGRPRRASRVHGLEGRIWELQPEPAAIPPCLAVQHGAGEVFEPWHRAVKREKVQRFKLTAGPDKRGRRMDPTLAFQFKRYPTLIFGGHPQR